MGNKTKLKELKKFVEMYHYKYDGEVINDGGTLLMEKPTDWILIVTAIPFVGAICILGYFLSRNINYYITEKDDKTKLEESK